MDRGSASSAVPTPEPVAGPRWPGTLAGVTAAGVALGVGQVIEKTTDVPGLVLAVGELVIDYVPGFVARESIENLGSAGKGNLVLGITVTALLIAGLLGRLSLTRHIRLGLVGFAGFGILGAWAVARNPQTPTANGIAAGVIAAVAGAATFAVLIDKARLWAAGSALVGSEEPLEDPRNPAHSRRSFLSWTTGAGAVAITGYGIGRLGSGTSRAELARANVALPDPVARSVDRPVLVADGVVQTEAFDVPGLSPWVTPSDGNSFYRIDTALSIPQVDPDDWSLSVTGLVDRPLTLRYEDLLNMDLVEQTITLSCVSNPIGGDLVGNAVWLGVPLVDVLENAGIQPEASQIVGRSVDDFTAGFPTTVLADGRNALIAVGMNGEPLPVRHGFPARLVVAGLYGYVSATKWLEEIRLTTWESFNGYWINLGWSKEGPMKTASRIDVPANRSTVRAGRVPIAGVAWAVGRGLREVQVRVDQGPWQRCDLAVLGSDETWIQWHTEWDATPGNHQIEVRAVDANGAIQSAGPRAVAPDGAEGYHQINVRVS